MEMIYPNQRFIVTDKKNKRHLQLRTQTPIWHKENMINLAVRYGSKTLELSKGKNAIELSTGDELIATISLLKDAVLAGELDDAISKASDKLRAGFGK